MSLKDNVHALEESQHNGEKSVTETIESIQHQMRLMEKFIARRFDEISMEINATAQQVDMAEDGIVKRFSEVLEILSAISYSGAGNSAANTGVELEAVIEDTEEAANTILDAADRISTYLDEDKNWEHMDQSQVREKIRTDIQEILMACTFQDLTGQRIRNTLNNLHEIESRLSTTFERLGIEVKIDEKEVAKKVERASNQEEIDALLKGFDAAKTALCQDNAVKNSQDDIDSMF